MQRVRIFRCIICGDPYIGFERPSNCPFCGAHEQYMVHSVDWQDKNRVDLTEVSRNNLEASLKLEIGNAKFYLCISKSHMSTEIKALFKALSKVESEHASTICKILRIKKPAIEFSKDLCTGMSDSDVLEEADRRENRAVALYTEFLKHSTEPRVMELFTALIEIESDHIDVINKESSEPSPELKKESEDDPPVDDDLKRLDRDETDFYESYTLHED